MRVKVREFVHYARKPGRRQPQVQGQHQTSQGGVGHVSQQPWQNIYPQQMYHHVQSLQQPSYVPQPGHHMGGQPQHGQQPQGQGYSHNSYHGHQQVVAQYREPQGIENPDIGGGVTLTPNKFAMPGDGVPGGVRQV